MSRLNRTRSNGRYFYREPGGIIFRSDASPSRSGDPYTEMIGRAAREHGVALDRDLAEVDEDLCARAGIPFDPGGTTYRTYLDREYGRWSIGLAQGLRVKPRVRRPDLRIAEERFASVRTAVAVAACIPCGVAFFAEVLCEPPRRRMEFVTRLVDTHLSECPLALAIDDVKIEWVAKEQAGRRHPNDEDVGPAIQRLYAAGWRGPNIPATAAA